MALGPTPSLTEINTELGINGRSLAYCIQYIGKDGLWNKQSDFANYTYQLELTASPDNFNTSASAATLTANITAPDSNWWTDGIYCDSNGNTVCTDGRVTVTDDTTNNKITIDVSCWGDVSSTRSAYIMLVWTDDQGNNYIEEWVTVTQNKVIISPAENPIEFTNDYIGYSVQILIDPNSTWSATTSDQWIDITTATGSNGDNLVFNVTNEGGYTEGTIFIEPQDFSSCSSDISAIELTIIMNP